MKARIGKIVTLFFRGNFKVRYAVALMIIAVLSTFLQVVVQLNLDNQKNGLTHIQMIRNHLSEIESIRKKLFNIQTIPNNTKFYFQLESTSARLAETLLSEPAVIIEHTAIIELLKNFTDIDHKSDRSVITGQLFELNQLLAKYVEDGTKKMDTSDRGLTKQLDRFRLIELSIFVLTLLVLVAEDLFIFRPAIKKLEQAIQDRSDFFSRIGHEIRNPMNSILGTVELLSETDLNSTQRNYLFRLRKSAQGLLGFLNNMIDYSSIENRHLTLNAEEFELKEFITEITSLFSLDTYRKGLDFYIYTDHLPDKITTDLIKVRHIILNLLGNAVKFTDKGNIFLSLTHIKATEQLIIRIRDTGIGIPDDKKDLIFDAFTQADISIKRKHGGTGLGLTITREYLDVLGGTVSVNSKPQEGSEFVVTIPLIASSGEFSATLPLYKKIYVAGKNELLLWLAAHRHPDTEIIQFAGEEFSPDIEDNCAILIDRTINWQQVNAKHCELLLVDLAIDSIPSNRFKSVTSLYPVMAWDIGREEMKAEATGTEFNIKQRVLICDDAAENRFIIKSYLQKLFQNIDEANGGNECIRMCQETKYDYLFLDIQMPDTDGYTVISQLKGIPHYQTEGKIIACTAHNSELESEKIKRSGFSGHLIKPVSFQALNQILRDSTAKAKIDDLDERIRIKLLAQRPLFIQVKLDEIADIEKHDSPSLAALKNFGHKLKGAASTYGFPELQRLGAKLEEATERRNQREIERYYQQIKEILYKEKPQ